jgi:membrane dipeptidase
VQDLQEELGMTQAAVVAAERAEFNEAMLTSGVTAIFQNAGEEGQDPLRLMKRLARFTYLTDRLRGTLLRATHPDDIVEAHKSQRHCLYLTGNGVPLPQTWVTVDEELGYIRLFFQLGIRMMHVTYNRRNMLGDGCAETANGGLSDLGRAAIAEMNRVGVIVDVAHSGWRTSLEAAQASSKPMVASHTVCAGLRNHIRAKPDEVIRAICDTGGLIGICWIPPFLGGTGDLQALLDHVDYAVKKFGVEHVAIGTDVAHTSQHAPAAAKQIPSRGKRRTRYEALWPPDALGGQWPRAGSLAWTNWPLVTVGLVQRGYTDAQIQQILGGNMLRVCRAVLPEPDAANPPVLENSASLATGSRRG